MDKSDKKKRDNTNDVPAKNKSLLVPKEPPLSDAEVIAILREDLIKKDKEIERLKEENYILLNLTYKRTKRKLEEDRDSDSE